MNVKTTPRKRSTPKKPLPENGFVLAVPEELGIPADPLHVRIDFHRQLTTITFFSDGKVTTRVVDAMDIVRALSAENTFSSGLLPPGTLWWSVTRAGPAVALYEEPAVRKLALQYDLKEPPKRFTIPLPGLLFLCSPGQPPYVYAVRSRPTKPTDIIYHAPFCNISNNGASCGGTNNYPDRVTEIPRSFFASFFTATHQLSGRSKKYPKNIVSLWTELDGQKEYPLDDLVPMCKLQDLIEAKPGR